MLLAGTSRSHSAQSVFLLRTSCPSILRLPPALESICRQSSTFGSFCHLPRSKLLSPLSDLLLPDGAIRRSRLRLRRYSSTTIRMGEETERSCFAPSSTSRSESSREVGSTRRRYLRYNLNDWIAQYEFSSRIEAVRETYLLNSSTNYRRFMVDHRRMSGRNLHRMERSTFIDATSRSLERYHPVCSSTRFLFLARRCEQGPRSL